MKQKQFDSQANPTMVSWTKNNEKSEESAKSKQGYSSPQRKSTIKRYLIIMASR